MNQQLLHAIRQTLGGAVSPNLTSRAKGFDLYEAYIFTLGVEACKRLGFSIAYKNRDGSSATTFCFRTGPGSLARGPYSHAEIRIGARKPIVEAHVGVKV